MTQVKNKNRDGTQVLVDCPSAVKLYNSNMGGVDLVDFERKAYSCTRTSSKWWHRIFYFASDVCIVNSHILKSLTAQQLRMNQKEFRFELAREFLACHNSRKQNRQRRSADLQSAQVREDHYLDSLSKPLQCQFYKIRKRTSYCCLTCNASNPVLHCSPLQVESHK